MGSFAVQNVYLVEPTEGQPGLLARPQGDYKLDSSYLSLNTLAPGQGVILDTATGPGYVKLAASPLTGAQAQQLIGIVSMNLGAIANVSTGPFTPADSNLNSAVQFPPNSPLVIATEGYFYVQVGNADVGKDQLAAFDPVQNAWVVNPNPPLTANYNTATFDEDIAAGSVGIVRLSGRVS